MEWRVSWAALCAVVIEEKLVAKTKNRPKTMALKMAVVSDRLSVVDLRAVLVVVIALSFSVRPTALKLLCVSWQVSWLWALTFFDNLPEKISG